MFTHSKTNLNKSTHHATQPFFSKGSVNEPNASFFTHILSPPAIQKKCAACEAEEQIQTKLTIGQPDDQYEREADAMADRIVGQSETNIQRQEIPEEEEEVQAKSLSRQSELAIQRQTEQEEEEEGIQAKPISGDSSLSIQRQAEEENEEELIQTKRQNITSTKLSPDAASAIKSIQGGGQKLSASSRNYFEARFGSDFSQVRVHTDSRATDLAQRINARAFTLGNNIVFNTGQYSAQSQQGKKLLAHELTHVIQQRHGQGPNVQRELIATGTEVNQFINLVEPAIGLQLEHDPVTNRITAIGNLGPPTSPALRDILTRIMNDPAQDAEVNFGIGQARVAVGAFPVPADMTGSRVQRIDMDDVASLEAGAPGNGLAKLTHEITENYRGHAFAPVAGVSRFRPSHAVGVANETRVAEELVGPGARVASVTHQIASNLRIRVQDFTNYYLVFELDQVSGTADFQLTNARRTPKNIVSSRTLDHFITGSDVLPATAGLIIAAAAADVAANPLSTVLIEGFASSPDTAAHNLALSERRANSANAALIAAGVGRGRIHHVGRGETNFVAPNNTLANRLLNQRIIITVTTPAP